MNSSEEPQEEVVLHGNRFNVHRLLLVSWETRFPHPLTGNPITVHAARDHEWDRLMGALGWANAAD